MASCGDCGEELIYTQCFLCRGEGKYLGDRFYVRGDWQTRLLPRRGGRGQQAREPVKASTGKNTRSQTAVGQMREVWRNESDHGPACARSSCARSSSRAKTSAMSHV